jgi:surface protein
VKRMNCMFCRCSNLTTLDVSNFNTGNVEDMSDMFSGCSGLTSLDVSKFNTTLVTEMGRMFSGCSGLTSLDLSFFDTDNVTDMSNMFSGCSALTTIYCEEAWNCDQSDGMFSGCTSLKGAIDFNSNNTNATYANPTDGYFTSTGKVIPRPYALLSEDNTTLTFYYDGNKKANEGMDIAFSGPKDCGWYGQRNNIKKVVFDDSFAECTTSASTAYWFYECYNLSTINGIEKLNTANVASMRDMFSCCYSLTDLDVSNFNTANVTDMIDMFACCSGLTSLDLSNFNTANVKRMNCMFYDCSDLTTIYCNDKWACGSSSDMFTGCTSLKGAISYDEEKTDVTYANPTTGYFTRKGDVNGDGIVSVADAVSTMDYINKKNPDNFNAATADMDGDGEVTVSDAIAILNMILNGQ